MYYYAVKHRLRFFKFAGNRYLELEDAKRLIRFFAIKLDTDFDEILDQLN